MNTFFNCLLNEGDTFHVAGSELVPLHTKEKYAYTLWTRRKGHLNMIPHFFMSEAIDLFYVSLMVFYADRKVLRRIQPDAWTRSITIYMPVLCLDKWNANKQLLEFMLYFLTGDHWHFQFRERSLNKYETLRRDVITKGKDKLAATEFCMLSGGLDSFIGATDLLALGHEPIFVGNYNGGKGVSVYQKKVIDLLSTHFAYDKNRFYQFYAAPKSGKEDTTRSRSLMFFAHAILLASGMGNPITLYVPENGVISLNIPLTVHRSGSLSTRTTHPHFMGTLRQLLLNMGLPISIVNPFQFKTKGEMVRDCLAPQFLKDNIKWTMSCSHPDLGRYAGDPQPSHCGCCLPCTIRRAAIKFAGIKDESRYRDSVYKDPEHAINLKSYRLGLKSYIEHPMHPLMAIQQSGPIIERHEDYADLYKRGMEELNNFIESL